MKTIYLVELKYKIQFNDADDGWCCAGDGSQAIKAFSKKEDAETFVNKIKPIIVEEGKETTIFPVQKNNKILKKELGFVLDDFNNASCFKLEIQEIEVE